MEIDFAGSDGLSMSEALAPACTLLIHLRSISTATERCNRLTDSTSFSPDLILRTIPDKPCSGPSPIRTTCPTSKYGQGIVGRPLLHALDRSNFRLFHGNGGFAYSDNLDHARCHQHR